MAPTKVFTNKVRNKIETRSTAANAINLKDIKDIVRVKRKADCSPSKENNVKRSALTDLSNNALPRVKVTRKDSLKKVTVTQKNLPSVKTVLKPRQNANIPPPAPDGKKVTTRGATRQIIVVPNQTAIKPKEVAKENAIPNKKRLSNEFEKTDEESLYSTALEEVNESTYYSARKSIATRSTKTSKPLSPIQLETDLENGSDKETSKDTLKETSVESSSNLTLVAQQFEVKLNLGNHEVPEGVVDFDKDHWNDVFQVSHYAMDIFNYLKKREGLFEVGDYMERQVCLTKGMRALLIDWMVEIQESFELNHETLYLGVKLVDMYLDKVLVAKETLQLVGAAAMFIASKYDERMPPQVNDFLYICDGAYSRKEMIRMEIHLLKVVDFELGIPISYRFLRRYARCARVLMPVLTLARFILELSLMDYETIQVRDSILAAASLYLALRMKKVSGWTTTLQFYTGYKLEDITFAVQLLNNNLHKPQKSQLMTVRNKYSHKIFFEVAKTPLLSNEQLFPSEES